MARPIISPVSIHPTAPETFAVLNQRMRVVEEQTNELLKDLHDVNPHSMELFPSKPLGNSEDHQSISPVRTRTAFVGGNDTLWRTCETLVNRVCRLESIIQTVKLNMFRLQTEKELNPKHAANLEQRLNAIQEEHIEELKVLQMEGRMLSQQLKESQEEEKRAKDQVQRLSAALEFSTATKRDVTIAAEELRASKNKMNNELQELTERLSKESRIRESLEESQAVLLYQIHEMEVTVEKERKQVHILKLDCNNLRQDIQMSRDRLQKEEEKAIRLEEECVKLKIKLESQEQTISKLSKENKTAQLSLSREHEENLQLQSEITALREVAEKVQVLNEQLSQQCVELSSTVRRVTIEKAQLIKNHQAALQIEQEKINQKLQEQDLILDAARASITGELHAVQNEKVQLQEKIQELCAEHANCKQKACEIEKSAAMQKEILESTVARVQSELKTAQQDRESLVKEQVRLKEEMQKTIREITGENKRLEAENKRLEAELMEKKLEVGPLKDTTKVLEDENKKLMEQEAAFKHQQLAQQQVKQVLEELTDNRNKLAYDKGKLQTRVKQLEEELQSLTDARPENSQLRKLNTTLETKYSQMHAELGSFRINMQRMEAQLKQAQSALACREEEFSVAAKARDEALRENQKLKGRISATEEREKHKVVNLQRELEESQEDNVKMTTMLKNLLASHNKMQIALEKVQCEMGRKDSEIAGLKKDRNQYQQRIQKLEEDLDQCHKKFILQSQNNTKMNPLCKALEVCKEENIKLAQDVEQALQANHALQSKLMLVQDELERKESECQQLLDCREQLIEETKAEAKLYAEHLETLKRQFQTEREVTRRAAQKESTELKKAVEEACSRSGEMSHHNKELRARVMELEKSLASQKEKVKRQKALITQYFNTKANNAQNEGRIKEIQSELRQMEELKEQYQKKNHEQSLSIKEFVTELTSLQVEMQQLAKNQQIMATENQKLENQLTAERKQRKKMEEKCQALEDTVKCLKKRKEETEQKLKEASKESEQITANLEEAHHWFKSKFDSLQHELTKNRQKKNSGKNNYVEEEEQPVKLPNEACLKRWETKNHLKFVSRKYLNELND